MSDSKKKPRRRYSDAERREYIFRWQSSGLSRRAFCRRAGLAEQTLANWLRRYKGKPPTKPSCTADALFFRVPMEPALPGVGRDDQFRFD